MPQLDITILFPQVFFLFLFFITFYILLAYHFLPKFLTTLKLRRSVSEVNSANAAISTDSSLKFIAQNNLQKNLTNLQKNFQLVTDIFKKNSTMTPIVFDNYVSLMIFHASVFADVTVLKNIKLRVKNFNLQN